MVESPNITECRLHFQTLWQNTPCPSILVYMCCTVARCLHMCVRHYHEHTASLLSLQSVGGVVCRAVWREPQGPAVS